MVIVTTVSRLMCMGIAWHLFLRCDLAIEITKSGDVRVQYRSGRLLKSAEQSDRMQTLLILIIMNSVKILYRKKKIIICS